MTPSLHLDAAAAPGGGSGASVRWARLDRRLTIRGRLLFLLLTVAVPFVAYLTFSVWRQSLDERARAGERMLGIARLTAARLDDHVGDVRQALDVLAQVADFSPDAVAANDALLHRLQPHMAAQVRALGVWRADGSNVGSSGNADLGPPASIGQLEAFQRAAASGKPDVESTLDAADPHPVSLFVQPVMRDGRFIGAITASSELRTLQTLLSPGSGLPEDTLITVIDVSGKVVARSLDPEHWIGHSMHPPGEASRPREGAFDRPGRDGILRIGGVAHSRRTPWAVYVGIPRSIALADLRTRVTEYVLLGGTMLLLGLLAAARVARRISEPLQQLGDDAAALERGDWAHRSRVREGGEIGRLAALLDAMASTVGERTASLVASEHKLREITDNLPVMISCLDAEQRFVFANRLYDDWLGIRPADLIGRNLQEVYGETTYAGFKDHIAAGLAGTRVVYERDLDALGGRRRIEVTLVPRRDPGGLVEGLFVLMQDVTENRQAVTLRIRSEERLSLALEGAGAALFDWNIAERCIYHSAQAGVLRGEAALEGTTPVAAVRRWVHPEDLEPVRLALERTFQDTSGAAAAFDAEFRIATRGGGFVWVRCRGRVVERDARGAAVRFTGTCSDVTRRKLIEDRLRRQASHDTLTGLPNRALFQDRLSQAMARQARSRSSVTAVLYLDIDHFKAVNDTFGHEAGDRLLTDFSTTLQSSVRASDTVARLAGDEFALILEGLRHESDATTVAQLLIERARQTVGTGPEAVCVTASIGLAFLRPEDDSTLVLRRADAALYDAKRGGRDRHAVDREHETLRGELERAQAA